MNELIQKLKDHIILSSKSPNFLHSDWFIDYHLIIVEKISLELCDLYKEADRDVVQALVWIHDYGKILDMDRQHELNHEAEKLLQEFGFNPLFVKTVMKYLELLEQKMEIDIRTTPIEVQIVSSADGASHMVGPFMSIHWKEYSSKSISELIQSMQNKLKKDWERKIVLPEVRLMFENRYNVLLEQAGNIPNIFLK